MVIKAWNDALASGYLDGKSKYIWDDFLEAYHWMMNQMKNKLPRYDGEYPIWVWVKRPDLRLSAHLKRGEVGVLLELNLDEKDVLFSDFMAWHIVLANEFLSLCEEEDKQYELGQSAISKEESWERIFAYKELKKFDYWKGEEDIQGVTGKVSINNIKHIKTFKAR